MQSIPHPSPTHPRIRGTRSPGPINTKHQCLWAPDSDLVASGEGCELVQHRRKHKIYPTPPARLYTLPMKPDIRNAPLELWRIAGAFIQIVFDLFGEPQRIASLRVFETAQHALALTWIRAGEWLVRELLLIEAALLGPLPAPAQRAKQAKTREKTPPLRRYHSFNPDDWRVSFQAIPTIAYNKIQEFAPLHAARPLRRLAAGAKMRGLAARVQQSLGLCQTPGPAPIRQTRAHRACCENTPPARNIRSASKPPPP